MTGNRQSEIFFSRTIIGPLFITLGNEEAIDFSPRQVLDHQRVLRILLHGVLIERKIGFGKEQYSWLRILQQWSGLQNVGTIPRMLVKRELLERILWLQICKFLNLNGYVKFSSVRQYHLRSPPLFKNCHSSLLTKRWSLKFWKKKLPEAIDYVSLALWESEMACWVLIRGNLKPKEFGWWWNSYYILFSGLEEGMLSVGLYRSAVLASCKIRQFAASNFIKIISSGHKEQKK